MTEDEFNAMPAGTVFKARHDRGHYDGDSNKYVPVPAEWDHFFVTKHDNAKGAKMGSVDWYTIIPESIEVVFTPGELPKEECHNKNRHFKTINACPWCGFDPLGIA